MITTDTGNTGKKPLMLRPETVRSAETSERLVQRAGIAAPIAFHQVERDAHPNPIPGQGPVVADVRPFHQVERDAHPNPIPGQGPVVADVRPFHQIERNAHPSDLPAR